MDQPSTYMAMYTHNTQSDNTHWVGIEGLCYNIISIFDNTYSETIQKLTNNYKCTYWVIIPQYSTILD